MENIEYSLEELLDMLIGHTDVWCETNHDNKSEENLKKLNIACCYLIDKLVCNYRYINRVEASARSIATKSRNIIETIYYQIEDIVEEIKEADSVCVNGITYAQLEKALDKACVWLVNHNSLLPKQLNYKTKDWKEYLLKESEGK